MPPSEVVSPSPYPPAGYRLLRAWQRALDVAAHADRLARALPCPEHDALAADLRRWSAAIPAYVAAGNFALDVGEHRRALADAQGALARVETLALLAERLAALPPTDVAALLAETADTLRLVRGLARAVGSGAERPDAAGLASSSSRPISPPPARARRPHGAGARATST